MSPESIYWTLISPMRTKRPSNNVFQTNGCRWFISHDGVKAGSLPQGNPKGFLSKEDLLRPGLRIAHRPKGAGAQKLIQAQIQSMGANIEDLSGPMAIGHTDVARLIEVGAADVGLAIESEALSSGLEFIPLTEERFDLITTESLSKPPYQSGLGIRR